MPRLDAAEADLRRLTNRPVQRTTTALRLAIDLRRIEEVGPVLEAVAAANRLDVRIPALDAKLARASLVDRPSRVWVALGRAAIDGELATARGEAAASDLFGWLGVIEGEGGRVVEARLPEGHPIGATPMDQAVKLDDRDWHLGGEGRAADRAAWAAAHIPVFLAWLIERDLVGPEIEPAIAIAVGARSIDLADVAEAADGVLVTSMLTDEGAEFAIAVYDDYLGDWHAAFGDAADRCLVPPTWATYEQMAPQIDARLVEWRGRRSA
jgi:hypothetical protein